MESNHSTLSNNNTNDINDQRCDGSDGIDYLSFLPIEVVLHIFSILPMKYWILMCLVSKRWKNFWTQTPNLELNGPVMVQSLLKKNIWCSLCDKVHNYHARDHRCFSHLRNTATENFVSIFDRILLLHTGCNITRFHLFINYNTLQKYASRIDAWVDFAMTRNIEKLELDFSGGSIPPEIVRTSESNLYTLYRFKNSSSFSSDILKTLILIGCIFELNVFIAFKSLQSMTLIDADIYSGSIGNLLSKFPLLKFLKLQRCLLPKTFMVCKEELNIKDLFLIECFTYTLRAFPIDIIAPRLSTLTITAQHLKSSSIRKAANLVNAEVGINGFPNPAKGNCMAALLIDLSQCHFLKLNSWCIQVLSTRDSLPRTLPLEFQNLSHLRLRIHMFEQELPGLSYLFSSCPRLEALTLDINLTVIAKYALFGHIQNAFLDDGEESYWEAHSFTFHCLQRSLKIVNVNGFAGTTMEINILTFLLQNAMVLEELNIAQLRPITPASSEQKLAFMRLMQERISQITSSGKASPHARIKILS